MRAANGGRGRFRQPEMLHLASLNQILDCPGDVFDRHVGIDPVLVVEIDRVDPEPPQ
jgi:hypothetical protein